MAFVCSDCVTWIKSKDANRYGEKYCDYDQKYRSADQNIYGCRGFVWARRVIITKVCEILGVNPAAYFDAFDDTKDNYIVPCCIDKLIDYNTIGPIISDRMDHDLDKEKMAKYILDNYIIPAEAYAKMGNFIDAVSIYQRMIQILAFTYYVDTDNLKTEDNSIKYTKSL